MRLPNEDSPQTMYNKNGIKSTWTKVETYNGMFPRVSSGSNTPTAFGSTGAEQLPNIKGLLIPKENGSSNNLVFASGSEMKGCFVFEGAGENKIIQNTSITTRNGGYLEFSANRTFVNGVQKDNPIYQDDGHVLPLNFGIELWRRTK